MDPAQTENPPVATPQSDAPRSWAQLVLRNVLKGLLVASVLGALALGGYVGFRNGWAWYHYGQAQKTIANDKLEEALAHLELSLTVWKRSAETNFLAARTARRNGDYEKAERYLRESEKLGWVQEQLTLEAALLLAERDNPLKVEGFLQERIRRDDPDTSFILEALAQGYLTNMRWGPALNSLDKLLQLEPDNRRALYRRGRARAQLGLDEEALADFRRVLELDPDNDDARLARAELLLRHKSDYQQAAQEFEHLRERQPDKAPVALGLARAYRGLRRRQEARQLLDQILVAFPRDSQALSERGRLAVDSGQYADAEGFLIRSLNEDRSDADTIADLIHVLRERKKPTEAKEWEKRLIQLKADKERFVDLSREMAERPRDPAPRLEAGQIMLRNGQEREAIGWFQLALQLDPRHRPTHRTLADFWESKGDAARAADHKRMAEGR